MYLKNDSRFYDSQDVIASNGESGREISVNFKKSFRTS